ncbi:MAG TPA: OmpH family outer membrane protein [Niabella sp.]|nr:OmpH family outer membrane protein [Niabella sp.]HOZ98312.1 OmpH family outer membrane protein [Niabella sp.]HQW13391.1 OmpH family outer membrane protein [Niabella sp.]HQX18785.1 OmpH family outer membrane protein [Niabella sp.]HQX42659.1 OmpH family outer membrane protein [Niabella sp.]
MKKVKFLAVSIGLVLAGTFSAHAQKIAAVNVDALVGNLPEAQKTQEAFQKWQEDSVGSQYMKIAAELQEKDSILKKTTTPSVQELLKKDIQEKQYTLANWQQIVGPAVQQKQQQMFGPLYDKVMKAIQVYAKEKGYTYVLAQEAFVVIPDADNISMAVAQKLGIKVNTDPATPAKK